MRFGVGVKFIGPTPLLLSGGLATISSIGNSPFNFRAYLLASTAVKTKSLSTVRGTTAMSAKAAARYKFKGGISAPTSAGSGTFNDQTGTFTIEWDAVPLQSAEDVEIGLSNGPPPGLTAMACIIRFNTTGTIDVRNGSSYTSDVSQSYTANQSFHFKLNVRMSSHTYDVLVTPSGGSQIALATNYAFRTEQAAITDLNYLSSFITSGTGVTMTNMIGPPPDTSPPLVANQSFILGTSGSSFVAGDIVGTMTGTHSPTTWTITAGNASGFYAISNSGVITVTSAGVTGLNNQTGTSALTCQATNGFGSGSGTATVNYSPSQPWSGIPTSFNDPLFTNMTETTTPVFLAAGANLSGTSFTSSDTSGVGTIGCNGNNIITKCRVSSFETVRISNAPNTNVTFNTYYGLVRAGAPAGAHQDGCQFFIGSGSSGGVVTFNNCMIEMQPGVSSTADWFAANNWGGDVHFNQCIAGPNAAVGIRLAADGGKTINAYFNGVYFVGSGVLLQQNLTNNPNSRLNIIQWQNVFNATIDANGKLVVGSAIAQPAVQNV